MKVTFDRQDLTHALRLVKRTTCKDHPTLAGVHISAGDGITLRTTDLDCGLSVGVQGDGEGEVVLPAAEFTALVEKSPTETVHLEAERGRATLCMGRAEYRLHTHDEEYPDMPACEADPIEMPAVELLGALERTVFATADDGDMPILGGVSLCGEDGVLTVTATDGYRVANYVMGCDVDMQCVIPAESVTHIMAMLKEYPASHIYFCPGRHVFIESDAAICHTVQMEGKYPDVIGMLSLDGAFSNKADKQELVSAVERASIVAENLRGAKRIDLRVGDGEIGIRANSTELGTAEDVLEAETNGEVEVLVDARYLLDGLKHVKSDTVEISFTSGQNPLVLEDGSWSCCVLPMKPRGGEG